MIRRFILAAAMAAALLASAPDGRRWWSHVQYLADDKLEGRDTGSAGHRKAAAYVAGEFERAGLKPAGTDGYIQPVRFHTRRLKEMESSLTLVRNGESEELVLGEDAIIGTRIDPAPSADAGAQPAAPPSRPGGGWAGGGFLGGGPPPSPRGVTAIGGDWICAARSCR